MPSYSQEEVISGLTSLYQLLTTLYLPPDSVLYPPPGGWPEITKEKFAFLGKTDAVIELLRNIPYIRYKHHHEPYLIYDDCTPIDYRGEEAQLSCRDRNIDYFSAYDDCTVLPEHVVSLAMSSIGRNGSYIYLDTERGTVTQYSPHFGSAWTNLSEEAEGEHDGWREQGTRAIPDFFEWIKQHYRELVYLPLSETEVCCTFPDDYRVLKDIYRRRGWPSDTFQKQGCLEEVKEARKSLGY